MTSSMPATTSRCTGPTCISAPKENIGNCFSCTATFSCAGFVDTSRQWSSRSAACSIATPRTSALRVFYRPPGPGEGRREKIGARPQNLERPRSSFAARGCCPPPRSSTIEDSFKRANICLNDIGRLIGLSRQLLDTWARKLDCFSHNQSSVKPDLKAVMDTLLRARIERHAQERLQRERARAARRTLSPCLLISKY